MPITITMPPTVQSIGPGFLISVHTDYGGPFDPSTLTWIVRAQGGTGGEFDGDWTVSVPCTGAFQVLNLSKFRQVSNAPTLAEHESVILSVSLVLEAVGDVDTFYQQTGWTWDPVANMAMVVQDNAQTGGGLTTEEHDAVIETNQLSLAINSATTTTMQLGDQVVTLPIGQIFSSHLLDALTTDDLSSGVTCDPVRVDLSGASLYGVILVITNFPDNVDFRTPDLGYAFPDLAVLTVIRGGHILLRHGIHTLSHTIYPLPGLPLPWLTNLAVPVQPPDYHINVDWAVGVCGQLIGLKFP